MSTALSAGYLSMGALDDDARGWLDEADAVCRERELRGWAQQVEALRGSAPGER